MVNFWQFGSFAIGTLQSGVLQVYSRLQSGYVLSQAFEKIRPL